MKRILTFLTLFLIAGSMTAFGYALFRIGMIGDRDVAASATSTAKTADEPKQSGSDREKNLSWMQEIKGLSNDDVSSSTKKDDTATSTLSTNRDASATSTSAQTPDSTDSENEDAQTQEPSANTEDPTITDLGKSDALTSSSYDYAFKALVLSAEIRHGTVFLTWTPATNESFTAYKIIRSAKDENPFYPKTGALKTIKEVAETAYTDSRVNQGDTYYYRICMTKKDKPSACGNIIKVTF